MNPKRGQRQTNSGVRRTNRANYQKKETKNIAYGGFSEFFDTYVKYPAGIAWAALKESKKPDLDGFKKTRKHRPDYLILLFMGILMMIGLIIMYAIGPQRAVVLNNSYGSDYAGTYFFMKQGTSLALSLVAFFVMSKMPLEFLYKHSGKILIVAYLACALLAILGALNIPLAKCELGACRWYNLGIFGSMQPAEFLKLGLLIALSVFLGAKAAEGKINNLRETLLPTGILVLITMIFVAGFQKDLGTAISALAIVVSQLVMAGLSNRNIAILGGVCLALMVVFIAIAPHRLARLSTFGTENCADLTSEENAGDYHICHAKIAIGSGGMLGVGIGNSVQATGYLPEAINDSVFAILGETFGFVGLTTILALFFGLIMRILRVADYIKNPASRILAAGVFGWLAVHVVMNVSAMIGLIPLTGITLPLLSFGGTSMIFISAALGIVFQLSAYTSFTPVGNLKEDKNENSSSRRGIGRTRYTSSRRH